MGVYEITKPCTTTFGGKGLQFTERSVGKVLDLDDELGLQLGDCARRLGDSSTPREPAPAPPSAPEPPAEAPTGEQESETPTEAATPAPEPPDTPADPEPPVDESAGKPRNRRKGTDGD